LKIVKKKLVNGDKTHVFPSILEILIHLRP